ncbi:MAG: Hsp70 family protein [Oscillibacter sp.]|nr:Hsp70 family protein [Oscillibacter sp.]
MEERNIGIDLGTTNTAVSVLDGEGMPETIKLDGGLVVPSVMYFESPGNIVYGRPALKQLRQNSRSIVRLFKTSLGDPKARFSVHYAKDAQGGGPEVYITDTNALCSDPALLTRFYAHETVILPLTVTEELGFRAKQPETMYSAERALRILAEKDGVACKIEYEESDLSLLPPDFFQAQNQNDRNDHKILSIAVRNKDRKPVIITNDGKFTMKIRAGQLGVEAMTLGTFRNRRLTNQAMELSAEDAAAQFLSYICERVQEELECERLNAVVTVPAGWGILETEATKRAAKKAGFVKVAVEKEPVAAAVAYALDETSGRNILVYDFGGGTVDVALIRSGENHFEILGSAGKNTGGQDFTDRLRDFVLEQLDMDDIVLYSLEESRLSEEEFSHNRAVIDVECERVKVSLSTVTEETFELNNLHLPGGGLVTKTYPITREELNGEVADLAREPIGCVERAILDAQMKVEDVDVAILSGGTSLMPVVREKVKNFIGNIPLYGNKNPALLISHGAAILAEAEFSEAPAVPPIRRVTKTNADFGIATEGQEFDCIIKQGTTLPVKCEKTYFLKKDGQQQVQIKLYTRPGDSQETKVYRMDFVDRITLSGLPKIKQTDAQIKVAVSISEEYELTVEADVIDGKGSTVKDGTLIVSRDSII